MDQGVTGRVVRSGQTVYTLKVRIYFEATRFTYELPVGCERKKRVKDDSKVVGQTARKIGLLFMELGKMVRKAGFGEY